MVAGIKNYRDESGTYDSVSWATDNLLKHVDMQEPPYLRSFFSHNGKGKTHLSFISSSLNYPFT